MHETSRTLIALAALMVLAVSPLPAHAGRILSQDHARVVSHASADVILEIAQGLGSAELATDSAGDPKISGVIDGTRYGIVFYGCENGANCTHIQLFAGWSDAGLTLNDVNRWNRESKFGDAYLDDDGDPWIEMAVNLAHGVTRRNLEDTFDWWRVILDSFKDAMNGE